MHSSTIKSSPGLETASLKRFRFLLFLAAVLYPIWVLVLRPDSLAAGPELAGRLLISGICLAIVAVTHFSAAMRRHIEAACLGLGMLIAVHNMWTVLESHLDFAYVVGYVLAMVGIASVFESRWTLVTFILWAGGLAFLPAEDGLHVTAAFFRASTLTGLCMSYLSYQDKLRLFTALKRDIESQSLVREKLISREAHFRAVIDAIPGSVAWVDRDLNYLGVNQVLSGRYAIPPAEFFGKPFGFMGGPGVDEARLFLVDLFAAEGPQLDREIATGDKENRRFFLFSGARYRDGQEAILIGLDISDRKRAERSVQDQKELLSQVLDHIPQGIYVKDAAADFRYVIWNSNMERLSGRARADVLGRTDRDLLPGRDADRQRRLDAYVLADGAPLDVPEEEVKPGDRSFPAHTVRVPVFSAAGEARMVLGVVEDITDTKQREELIRAQQALLMHASKMSTLGEMSGGVAHEINNPLTIITGFAQRLNELATERTADWPEIQRYSSRIVTMAERIARIVRGLRTFAREASADPFERLALARLIADTLELCQQRFLNHGVEILVDLPPAALELDCRAVQLSQVLLNLLNNSLDAIMELPEKWVRIDVEDLGNRVRLAVTDAGAGISADIAAKMLHPFFTTKGVGQGTGLGLSISQGIVESHGGTLYYDPAAANTRFIVELPKNQGMKQVA